MVGGIDPISSDALPAALTRLLDPGDSGDEDVAWREFVGTYSTLLLQVARSTATSRDAAMDTYTFVLEQLREQRCRRLRAYAARDGARFSTWLIVVAKRLCVDFHRRRYGRPQGTTEVQPHELPSVERSVRRRLVDLTAEAIDPDTLAVGSVQAARESRSAMCAVGRERSPRQAGGADMGVPEKR